MALSITTNASNGLAEGSDSSESVSSDDLLEPEPIVIEQVKSAPEMDRVRDFNTGFKRDLINRNRQDSLQLLKVRQQQQEEQRRKMEEDNARNEGNDSNDANTENTENAANSESTEHKHDDIGQDEKEENQREHVHTESINVFDRNKLADVIQEVAAETISPISPLEMTESIPNGTAHGLSNGPSNGSAAVHKVDPHHLERGHSACSDSEDVEDGDDGDDDKEFQSELEEDFEERQGLITIAVKEYTTTIKVFETGRKRLANRFVVRAKRRRSSALQQILRDRARSRGTALAVASSARSGGVGRSRRRRNGISVAVRKRRFDNARSRRGSSFVDDYNVNDTLFFDGEEAEQAVSDDEELAVDTMGDSDDDDDGDDEKEEQMADTNLSGTSYHVLVCW